MTTAEPTMRLRGERAPFVMLPRWLLYHPDVDPGAKFLYCVLHDLVAGREGPTRPVTRAQLAAACGVSVDTIDRRLAQLVAARAVEKQAQVPAGGQTANVYQVWLTPPEGHHRQPPTPEPGGETRHDPSPHGQRHPEPDDPTHHPTAPQGKPSPPDDTPHRPSPHGQLHGPPTSPPGQPNPPDANRSRNVAAPVEGSANSLVSRGRDSAAPPQGRGTPGRGSAAPSVLEEDQERPPQPPRRAGGPDAPQLNLQDGPAGAPATRRAVGTNLRSVGANPRAEAERLEQTREREAADRREADLAAASEARRAAEAEADAAARDFEAEADALSAVLDDDRLAAVVTRVGEGLAGPLARSPYALSRAVVGWCRASASRHPDARLLEAVDAALADDREAVAPDAELPPLDLPAPAVEETGLRERIAALVRPAGHRHLESG